MQELRTRPGCKIKRSFLARESYRVNKEVKTRSLANLTRMPEEVGEAVRAILLGKNLVVELVLRGSEVS
uniref:hypothetical protein n=1 Tax=Methylacidimicrobium cyclopophantes TaxID=1041766 RepID=UPI00115872A0|nr:hypothetical protein [Methylacidimicrobium cyclopophantes]